MKITHSRLHAEQKATEQTEGSDHVPVEEPNSSITDPNCNPESLGKRSEEPAALRDPLRWFGVVPPSLRDAQGNFQEVVLKNVPDLINLVREIGEVEIDIRRTRKKISKLDRREGEI